MAKRKPNGQDSAVDPAEAVTPLLAYAMRQVFRDHAARVSEGKLGSCERDSMFFLVFLILLGSHSNLAFVMGEGEQEEIGVAIHLYGHMATLSPAL